MIKPRRQKNFSQIKLIVMPEVIPEVKLISENAPKSGNHIIHNTQNLYVKKSSKMTENSQNS